MNARNVHQLIIDYYAICEHQNEILDLAEFIDLWTVATDIAEDTAPAERELLLARIKGEF